MFRHFADAQSANHIEQIRKNAEIIQNQCATHSIASKLALLLNAIDKFEKHRTKDFMLNDNSRAMMVLHAGNVYYSHFEKHLVHSSLYAEAADLFTHLSQYLNDVMRQIQSVNADLDELRVPLLQQARDNLDRLTAARYQQQIAAQRHIEILDTLLLKTAEAKSYDYFGVSDFDYTDEPQSDAQLSQTAFDNASRSGVNVLFQPGASLMEQSQYALLSETDSGETVEFEDRFATEELKTKAGSDSDETIEIIRWADDEEAYSDLQFNYEYSDKYSDFSDDTEVESSDIRQTYQDELSSSTEKLSLSSSHSRYESSSAFFSSRRSMSASPIFSRGHSPANDSESELDSGYSSGEMQPLLPRP